MPSFVASATSIPSHLALPNIPASLRHSLSLPPIMQQTASMSSLNPRASNTINGININIDSNSRRRAALPNISSLNDKIIQQNVDAMRFVTGMSTFDDAAFILRGQVFSFYYIFIFTFIFTFTAARPMSGLDRYREVFEQLTGLLRMCDDIIEKFRTVDNIESEDADIEVVSDDEPPPTTATTVSPPPNANPSEQEK